MDNLQDTLNKIQKLRPKVGNEIKKFSRMILLINDFFNKKSYNNNSFLVELRDKIKKDCDIDMSNKKLSQLLLVFNKNKGNYNKIKKLHKTINVEVNKINPQIGGFIYNDNENGYSQVLSMLDFIFDLINLIPNNIITKNYNFIAAPYGILAILLNLLRADYDFAFYSFVGLIPGVGGAIAGSVKIIHRIIKYITRTAKVDNAENYYKQLQSAKRVHDYLRDDSYERKNNPFIGDFEDNYKYDDYFDDELNIT